MTVGDTKLLEEKVWELVDLEPGKVLLEKLKTDSEVVPFKHHIDQLKHD